MGGALAKLRQIRELGLAGLIAVVFVLLAFTNSAFLSKGNLAATGNGMAPILIVTIGMTITLISGGFDLSVGGVVALSSVLMLVLVQAGFPAGLGLIVAIVAGMSVGLLNGFLITKVGINPLITTLGTLGMSRGIAAVISRGTIVSPGPVIPDWFLWVGQSSILGVRTLIVLPLVIVVVVDLLTRRSRFFRKLYYLGGSERAAQFAGIDVAAIKMVVYWLSSTLAALAGYLLASRFGAAAADFGTGYEMQAISAAVIGGASLTGGAGSIVGSFLAVLLLALVQDAILLYRVSVFWQDFISGSILIIAVAVPAISAKRETLARTWRAWRRRSPDKRPS